MVGKDGFKIPFCADMMEMQMGLMCEWRGFVIAQGVCWEEERRGGGEEENLIGFCVKKEDGGK